MKSELDLAALEREMHQPGTGWNAQTAEIGQALIQRLREAEAGYDNSKLMSENYVKDLQRRVELLERVRERLIAECKGWIHDEYDGTSGLQSRLDQVDALAAVEESDGG